jgi:hypothetical protein
MSQSRVPRDPNLPPEMRRFLDDLARYQVRRNLTATGDPAVTDDADLNYEVGSTWINLTSDHEFVCLDATVGAAVWKQTT